MLQTLQHRDQGAPRERLAGPPDIEDLLKYFRMSARKERERNSAGPHFAFMRLDNSWRLNTSQDVHGLNGSTLLDEHCQ